MPRAKQPRSRAIAHVLERDGKRQTYTLAGTALGIDGMSTSYGSAYEAANQLVALCRTRVGQGWRGSAESAVEFVAALRVAGLDLSTCVRALDDAELDAVYRDAIKRGAKISVEVLRARPTRELFRWMLGRFATYYEDDLTKAVKFLGKDPERAAWLAEEMRGAKKLGERAAKFAARNAAKLEAGPKPAPVPPAKPVADEASLLAAIAAEPADDAPRLVYADWLLDRGDGFGELVQVSCKLAPLDFAAPEYADTRALADKLERKHAKAWLEPIRPFIRTWSFARGLLGDVTCDAKLFTQAAAAIAARAPRGTLRLTGLKAKDVPALAACPLGAFGTIFLDQQRIDDAQLATLMASPTIAGAGTWRLKLNAIGDAGLVAIARSPYMASVRELDLRANDSFSPAAFGELLASPHLHALRSLWLAVTAATGAFERCTLALTELRLLAGEFGDADAAALVGARSLAKLEQLFIQPLGSRIALSRAGRQKLRAKFPGCELG